MFWLIVFGIIFIGLLFVLAEILFVPGGILGIAGLLILLYGIYYGFTYGEPNDGYIVLGVTFLITLSAIIYAVRTKTWKRISLEKNMDQKFNVNTGIELKKGDEGRAVTRLNPMGKARFGDDYAEVISMSGFLDEGSEIKVHKIEGSKIYVKLKE
jgi:membrane-bound ClpP family serine protease